MLLNARVSCLRRLGLAACALPRSPCDAGPACAASVSASGCVFVSSSATCTATTKTRARSVSGSAGRAVMGWTTTVTAALMSVTRIR
jgi:hypothetical protein